MGILALKATRADCCGCPCNAHGCSSHDLIVLCAEGQLECQAVAVYTACLSYEHACISSIKPGSLLCMHASCAAMFMYRSPRWGDVMHLRRAGARLLPWYSSLSETRRRPSVWSADDLGPGDDLQADGPWQAFGESCLALSLSLLTRHDIEGKQHTGL
eukprot:365055-Chlamydomonas_euryale.AAC.4